MNEPFSELERAALKRSETTPRKADEMRVFKRVPRHVEEYLQELYTTCDVCGENTNGDRRAPYEDNEITLEARIGDVYPEDEGDRREVAIANFCPTCFREKVKPALVAIGTRFREFRCWEKEPKIVDGKVEAE